MRRRILNWSFVALGIWWLAGCGVSSPGSTVREFYGHIQARNAEKALRLVSRGMIETVGETKLLTALAMVSEEMEKQGGIRSVDIRNEVVEEKTAKVSATIRYGNGDAEETETPLVLEEGQWKLAPVK